MSIVELTPQGISGIRHAMVAQRPVGEPKLVSHAGLLDQTAHVTHGSRCAAMHCGPPLEISPAGAMTAHLVGSFDLTRDETERIEDWLHSVKTQTRPAGKMEHYVLIPPARLDMDARSGRPLHWRFSCAGFVWKAYQSAGIVLVDLQTLSVKQDTIERTWGKRQFEVARGLSRKPNGLGLSGSGPWRLLLPAHLCHAFALARNHLPLSATDAHVMYPE